MRPGEVCILAVTSALGRMPYAATAAASEALEGFALPAAVFRRLFEDEPALQQFIMRLVAERIAAVMVAVVEVGFHSLDRRLARFLLDASSGQTTRSVQLSHEEIAHELGTAREVVTRVLDVFEARGMVSLGRRRMPAPARETELPAQS